MLRFHDSLCIPYIGSLKADRHTGANYCQYWGIIQYCLENRIRRFALGRSPVRSTHAQFKQKWGAQAVPVYYNYYQLNSQKTYISAAAPPARYRLAAEIWKRIPLGLTRHAGQYLARYIP